MALQKPMGDVAETTSMFHTFCDLLSCLLFCLMCSQACVRASSPHEWHLNVSWSLLYVVVAEMETLTSKFNTWHSMATKSNAFTTNTTNAMTNICTTVDKANSAWLWPTVTTWNVQWRITVCDRLAYGHTASLIKVQENPFILTLLHALHLWCEHTSFLTVVYLGPFCFVHVCVGVWVWMYLMSSFLLIAVVMHVSCRAWRVAH